MYEELKQEIRDVVKPNFRQQINGQNLQDVLIDMVDNYPAVSGSEELNNLTAKSGSWDNAADWITNNSGSLVTSESLAPVVEDLRDEIAEIGDTYATTASVNTMSASFDERINNIITGSGVDLSGYATTASVNAATESVKEWVENKHYLTEHQDISGLATTASVNSLSESVANDFANLDIPDISGLATTASVNSLSSSLHQDIQNVEGNLSEYATTASVNSLSSSLHNELAEKASTASLAQLSESVANDFANLDIPDISGLATTSSVTSLSESVGTMSASFDQRINSIPGSDLSIYATTASVNQLSESVSSMSASFDQRILDVSGSIKNLWYEGTGDGAIQMDACNAEGFRSLAVGRFTVAEGEDSYAEGHRTYASGSHVHTEGNRTVATVHSSHAEGKETYALADQAHAEGAGCVALGKGSHAEGVSGEGGIVSLTQIENSSYNYSVVSGSLEPSPQDLLIELYQGNDYDFATFAKVLQADPYNLTVVLDREVPGGNYTLRHSNVAAGEGAHAEGVGTRALGDAAHAEGYNTIASGSYTHAEGIGTIALLPGQSVAGQYNKLNSYQGASTKYAFGGGSGDLNRQNILEIFGDSVHVKGIGGYDGTNPIQGSNDLATILNNFETWTFVLEDSSSVTKSVLVR